MTAKLRIVASLPDDSSVKARVIRSVVQAGGRIESWVSKQVVSDVIHLTLVCGVSQAEAVHEIVRGIEEVQRAAVLGVGVFRGAHEVSLK